MSASPGEHSAPPRASPQTPPPGTPRGPEGAGRATRRAPSRGRDYRPAGVNTEAGTPAVALRGDGAARPAGPEVIGGIGGFAGLFDASRLTGYRRPLLATATDGVGTKVVIAQQLGVYDTVGIDLVGMVVDDVVVCGAEHLFLTHYLVSRPIRPDR